MADTSTAKNFDLALPNTTGDIPTGASTPSEREEEAEGRNPARDEYYRSLTNRNLWATRLSKLASVLLIIACAIFPIIVAILIAVAGYYYVNLRDPLIRLEDKVGEIQNNVTNNSQDIQSIKNYLFPIPKK